MIAARSTNKMLSLSVPLLFLAACDYQSDPEEARTYDVPTGEDAAGSAVRPVQIGFDGPRFAACAGNGEVTNITEALSVRAAPSGSAAETDQLAPGSRVAMCQKVGGWFGIVYPPPPAPTPEVGQDAESEDIPGRPDCGTGAPVADVRNYDGPRRSGWVHDDYIKLVAGR